MRQSSRFRNRGGECISAPTVIVCHGQPRSPEVAERAKTEARVYPMRRVSEFAVMVLVIAAIGALGFIVMATVYFGT
jgi:hypothetical protein